MNITKYYQFSWLWLTPVRIVYKKCNLVVFWQTYVYSYSRGITVPRAKRMVVPTKQFPWRRVLTTVTASTNFASTTVNITWNTERIRTNVLIVAKESVKVGTATFGDRNLKLVLAQRNEMCNQWQQMTHQHLSIPLTDNVVEISTLISGLGLSGMGG